MSISAIRIPCNTMYGKEGYLCYSGECTLKYWFCLFQPSEFHVTRCMARKGICVAAVNAHWSTGSVYFSRQNSMWHCVWQGRVFVWQWWMHTEVLVLSISAVRIPCNTVYGKEGYLCGSGECTLKYWFRLFQPSEFHVTLCMARKGICVTMVNAHWSTGSVYFSRANSMQHGVWQGRVFVWQRWMHTEVLVLSISAVRIPCDTVYGKEGYLCDNGECTLKYWFCLFQPCEFHATRCMARKGICVVAVNAHWSTGSVYFSRQNSMWHCVWQGRVFMWQRWMHTEVLVLSISAVRIPCNTVYGKEGYFCDSGECTLKYWFCLFQPSEFHATRCMVRKGICVAAVNAHWSTGSVYFSRPNSMQHGVW